MTTFETYKNQFPTAQKWQELIKKHDGIMNTFTWFLVMEKSINYYDQSNKVNSFIYKDNEYWLDKDTRVGLYRLIESGAETVTLQLGTTYVNIEASKLKDFLNRLEVYAGKCFSVTAKHLQALRDARSEAEVLAIDYTEGYPDKIILTND